MSMTARKSGRCSIERRGQSALLRWQIVPLGGSHSQCEVLHQDFLAMQLPESRFRDRRSRCGSPQRPPRRRRPRRRGPGAIDARSPAVEHAERADHPACCDLRHPLPRQMGGDADRKLPPLCRRATVAQYRRQGEMVLMRLIHLPSNFVIAICAGLIPIEFGSVGSHRLLPESRLPPAEAEPAAPEIGKLAKETPSSANAADSPLRDVRLTGVVIGPDLRVAIFAVTGTNSRVLSEGETLKGWRLESISPKAVMLSGPAGNIVLKPQPDANLVRPPPPVAVQSGQPDPPMAGAAGEPRGGA